jgi:HAD superfamily hydrolase (TIGR01509 family)
VSLGCASSVKAILWDNDGVLVDTEKLYYQANVEVLAGIGFELTREMYRDLFLIEAIGAWHLVAAQFAYNETQIQEIREKRNARHIELLENEDLEVPGMSRTLRHLSNRYCMGVVTSSEKDSFEAIHSKANIMRYFDFTVVQGDYTHIKPDPEPYLVGIKKSGYSAEECIAIEDSERGLIAAKAAGLRCWIMASDLTEGSDFSRAEGVLEGPEDILALFG